MLVGSEMPLKTKPEDKPAAICFSFSTEDDGLEITCSTLPQQQSLPYHIQGGNPHFTSQDDFKKKIVEVGMTPAAAETPKRSFNATARQLRELGFSVEVEENAA